MNSARRPKFFRNAAAAGREDGFALVLDGKPVKTPNGASLLVPTDALADALAQEWNALQTHILPEALPLTRLANTAIDGVGPNRSAVLDDLTRYAGIDLLCYRAAEPEALVARERAAWDPLLSWVEETLGANLHITAGIMHRPQPEAAVAALAQAAARFNDFALTGLHLASGLTGSVVLGLALALDRISPEAAWDAATVDETFQAELWGWDEEARARLARLQAELAHAVRFIRLTRV